MPFKLKSPNAIPAVGRHLFYLPGYTFRLFVANNPEMPEDVWRDYNQRAGVGNCIAELKYDLAANDFCWQDFIATELAFCAILLLFNLLSEF